MDEKQIRANGLVMVMLPMGTLDVLRQIADHTELSIVEVISRSIADYAKRCGVSLEEPSGG